MQFEPKMQLLFIPFVFIFTNFVASSRIVTLTGDDDVAATNTIPTLFVHKSPRFGNFVSVQSAIDSVPSNNSKWFKIHIGPGIYKEKVEIPIDKPYIFLEGRDRKTTVITYDGHGRTDLSATFSSFPDNIIVKGITFKNSFNLGAAGARKLYEGKRIKGSLTQALAARIYGDKLAFFNCAFLGVQDTLWDVQGRHYYYNSYFEGSIDFIFGTAQSIFEDCWMNVNVHQLPPEINQGFITAQGRNSVSDTSGFVFIRGNVTGNGLAFLGRAYGPYSRVIFYGTAFSSVVVPLGWQAWGHEGHEANFMYAEVSCQGPGADTSRRVSWEKKLDPSQLEQFSVSSFINQDSWISRLPVQPGQ